ncbi:MAG: alanine racemase [Vicinamibacterales bacterium]
MSVRHTVAHVDLDALARNFQAIAAFLARRAKADGRTPPGIIAVVKANAYGLGAVRVARALERAGATRFAVADIEEGVELRDAGVAGEILVFGALGVSDLAGVFTHRLTPTVSTPTAARALNREASTRGTILGCHLKIDTGMHRLGFRADNLRRTMPALLASPHLRIDAVYTHFATADDRAHPLFDEQLARFEEAVAELASLGLAAPRRHAAASAALVRDRRAWFDDVRCGLLLHGVQPLAGEGEGLALEPVLSVRSRVVAVKGVRPHETIGYGGRSAADHPRSIAIVPAGYADGIDVRLGGRGAVLVRGNRVPIVGSVCMDMTTVDVTGLGVEPGDEVVILGRQGSARIGVGDMAEAIGTIPYELLCRVGTRIERVYVASRDDRPVA